eukprot:c23574_g1_i1 orf=398-1600(+)
MAAEWSFSQQSQCASGTHKEYAELYERAREATREAQRQGDAQLKAAIAAATAVPMNTVRICPLSLTFNNTGLERAYCQKSSFNSDKRDVIPTVLQFLLRATLICLLFQTRGSQISAAVKEDAGIMVLLQLLTRLLSHFWIAALCATMLIMHFRCSSWFQGSHGVVLLLALSLLWLGEAVAVFASCAHLALDLALIVSQCIFSSVLHRAPFCLHLKMRLFGFGLQTVGTLAMVASVHEALLAMFYFSMSHFFGVALAYISDQQSRVGFLKSVPHFVLDKMSGDSQFCNQQVPKRALGGFAGGFAGVSSLKCTHPPSVWTVSSSSYPSSSREDYTSQVPCGSSSTVENSANSLSSRHQYFSRLSSSNKETVQGSDTVCSAGSGLECNVFWQFRAAARGSLDG